MPEPFFVIATQNPVTQAGTFPLPESQLDRFLMRLSLGYPSAEMELKLLSGADRRAQAVHLQPVVSLEQLREAMAAVDQVRASRDLIDYIQRLLEYSRSSGLFVSGLSPRAGLGLLRAARAWALTGGRDYVIPEDVQTVFAPVCEHRLQPVSGGAVMSAAQKMLEAVPVVRRQ